MAEPAGNLGRHLFVSLEAIFPQAINRRGHTSATIQLQRGIKLPEAKGCLVAGRDETLVATGERFLHQFAAVGTLHVVPSPGCGQFQPLHYRVGGIHLYRVGVRLAIEVSDAYLIGIAVVVDDGLLTEMRVIIFGIQFQRLAEHRNIERTADTIVPGTLLFQIVDDQLTSASQKIIVLG